ncbi:MAG TPA: HAD-IB family hydrolase [Acidimicrobiales bacterium]
MTVEPTDPVTPVTGDRASAVHEPRVRDGAAAAGRPGLAAFDFDGTLAHRDTLVPFLRQARGTARVAYALGRSAGHARDRDALKVAAIGHLFRGVPADELDRRGRAYAATLPGLLRPEMLERLRWHRGEGHAVVIVSASLGVYLRPLAEHLGIDAALAVELVRDGDGLLTGGVVGELNTRGPEKVARLRAWAAERFGPAAAFELWAYGDSAGDEQMLAVADHPTWVGRRGGRQG